MELEMDFLSAYYNKTSLMEATISHDTNNTNYSSNITQHYITLPYHPITTFIEQYTIPVICLFGFIGNTISSIVFLQKSLRNSSCSIFLAARGISDNGFLSTLFIIWVSQTFNLQLSALRSLCKVIIFLTYVCCFISVWLVVLVTFENYIRTCKPYIVKLVCTTAIAKTAVLLLCIVSICLYNFPFWSMTAENCEPYSQYTKILQALIYTDSVVALAVPLVCIICLMTAIVCDLIKSFRIRRATLTTRINPLAKVTKILLAVTLTFFFLNLPSHIYRLIIMLSSFVRGNGEVKTYSILEEAIQQITLFMSYLSFSTNIIVYTIFGIRFKQALFAMLRIKSPRSPSTNTKLENTSVCNSKLSRTPKKSRSFIVNIKDDEYCTVCEPIPRCNTQ